MPYGSIPARLARRVAYQQSLSAMWDGPCTEGKSWHIARHDVGPAVPADHGELPMPELVGGWDGKCERCGKPVPWDNNIRPSGTALWIYDTPSGRIEPGYLYWADDYQGRCHYWDNCDGRHLHAMLPNGSYWDIDSRASNCTMKDDRTHRCWVRHGEPPNVTVDKAGHTCAAGAGSILAGDYHGFLQNGRFTAG